VGLGGRQYAHFLAGCRPSRNCTSRLISMGPTRGSGSGDYAPAAVAVHVLRPHTRDHWRPADVHSAYVASTGYNVPRAACDVYPVSIW
jgi:hypothetical protein